MLVFLLILSFGCKKDSSDTAGPDMPSWIEERNGIAVPCEKQLDLRWGDPHQVVGRDKAIWAVTSDIEGDINEMVGDVEGSGVGWYLNPYTVEKLDLTVISCSAYLYDSGA